VSARIQEMGVRLAIGAQPRDVKWLVFAQVMRLSVVGLTIGILVVIAGGRLLEELLFGVRAADPGTILIVALILSAVAVLAAWAPAARASRVDPIEALRYE
jgi:putative ABC transport system permease protein